MIKPITVLSLFDGISCGRLALQRAGIPVEKYYACEIKDIAIKIAKDNFPDNIYLGDVTKVDFTQFKDEIDLVIGGSPCFVAGTKVLTAEQGLKNIEDVKVGDSVLTHKLNWKKVVRTGNKQGKTFKLVAQGINSTVVTENHPYYVKHRTAIWKNKKQEYVFSAPEWVQAKDLKKGDYLHIPIIKEEENPYNLTDEECFILGRYMADGHTRKDLRFDGSHNGSRAWALILSIGFGKEFNTSINHSFYHHSKSVNRMVFSNKRLVEIAEKEIGCGSLNKSISSQLLKLPADKLKIFIDGYLSGDGSIKDGKHRSTTVSEKLALSLALAVAKVYRVSGCLSFFKRPENYVIEGRVVKQHDTYTFGFFESRKKSSKFYVEDDFVLVPFHSFTNLEKVETVYNLEVEDDNSYVANGAVVHNCQDCSQANPSRLGLDGPKSSLFFYYAKAVKDTNAKHFFLENVDMPGKDLETISRTMGTYPININSSLLSAQQRSRNYWFDWGKKQYDLWGFPTCDIPLPKDKGVTLQSILESGYADKPKQWCLLKRSYISQKNSSDKVIKGRFDRSMMPICFKDPDCKWESWRWHTQTELERLQTLPDGYTKAVDLWDASDCIGDGWTVDVIAYLFSFLKENLEKDLKN